MWINTNRFEGIQIRDPVVRKTIDYFSSAIQYIQKRSYSYSLNQRRDIFENFQPSLDYSKDLLLPSAYQNPSLSYTTKFVNSAINKVRCPINCVIFTPDARRILTAAQSGEFTLWNALTFNFETISQAHDDSIRTLVWSNDDQWLISADDTGIVKYWQSTMNNVKLFMAHKQPIREISMSPSDMKYVTCSDDATLKIFDFQTCANDIVLTGHGWDVKTVQWNPFQSLIVSGSKDHQIKLWDPHIDYSIHTIHSHKNSISRIRWSKDGSHFLSISKDMQIKLWDTRHLYKEILSYQNNNKESTSVAWHPIHQNVFVCGTSDGSFNFYLRDQIDIQSSLLMAHDNQVSDLCWNPLGHMLVSCSNDFSTKFWTRNRPGEELRDKYNASCLPPKEKEEALADLLEILQLNPSRDGKIPVILQDINLDNYNMEDIDSQTIPGINPNSNPESITTRSSELNTSITTTPNPHSTSPPLPQDITMSSSQPLQLPLQSIPPPSSAQSRYPSSSSTTTQQPLSLPISLPLTLPISNLYSQPQPPSYPAYTYPSSNVNPGPIPPNVPKYPNEYEYNQGPSNYSNQPPSHLPPSIPPSEQNQSSHPSNHQPPGPMKYRNRYSNKNINRISRHGPAPF